MADFDGVINPAAGWPDIPDLSVTAVARGGPDGAMNAQALAIAKRLAFLRDNSYLARTPEYYGAKGDGVNDDTNAIMAAYGTGVANGIIAFRPGANYRYTRPLTFVSCHLWCPGGRAMLIGDFNDVTKDGVTLSAVAVAQGFNGPHTPCATMTGVGVIAASAMRHAIRIEHGDYCTLHNVDIQRVVNVGRYRDGVHFEGGGDHRWIENAKLSNVRIADAGRNGVSVVVPAGFVEVFCNVFEYSNLEVRGCGLEEPGIPFRFYSLNTTDLDSKISQHTFYGVQEFQTNSTATNPNPDGIAATVAVGAPLVEYVKVEGATIECVPTYGTGLGINCTGFISLVYDTCLTFGFNGSATGFGGTGESFGIGKGGLNRYLAAQSFTGSVKGGTNAGTPIVAYQGGTVSGVGLSNQFSYEAQITDWGGATGTIIFNALGGLLRNDPFADIAGSIIRLDAANLGTGYYWVAMRGVAGTSNFSLYKSGSGVNTAPLTVADMPAPCTLRVAGTYPL